MRTIARLKLIAVFSAISTTSVFAQQRELDKDKVAGTTFPYEYVVDGIKFQINKEDLQNETIRKYVIVKDNEQAERYALEKKKSIQKRISSLEEIKTMLSSSIASKTVMNGIFLQVYGRFQQSLSEAGIDKKGLNALYRAQESYLNNGKTPKELLPYLETYLADVEAEIEELTRILNLENTADFLKASSTRNSTLMYEVIEGSGDRASYYKDRMFQKVRYISVYQTPVYEVPTKSEEHAFMNPFWKEVIVVPNEMDSNEWSWINDHLEEVNKSYPVQDSYYVHKDHPDYQVRNVRLIGKQIYKDKKLHYMSLDLRTNQVYDLNSLNKLVMAIMRKAYQENKYNFKNESKDARMVVEVRTGLFYDHLKKELMECILGQRYFIDRDMAKYNMNESDFRKLVTPANRYEQQLIEDYKNQLTSMKVKRLSDTSFIYYSTDGKLEIKEEWNDTGNSVCTVLKY